MLGPFLTISRDDWSKLRDFRPLPLAEPELDGLHGINEHLSTEEVADVYLPLSQLLNLYVSAAQRLHSERAKFLAGVAAEDPVPYVIAVAGSVAAGKSTTARILQALLARWPEHPRVELVTTDGFLYANAELDVRGLTARKGFPETYDVRRLVRFLADVKAGRPEVRAPVYSHEAYDIVPGQFQVLHRPDVVIIEGLNVLQSPSGQQPFVSDFLDFSIYVDASEADIERWYTERFLTLRDTSFQDPSSFYHPLAGLADDQITALAHRVWRDINGINLRDNIGPSRWRAHLILEKGPDHSVQRIRLRKL
jgi:type I pantothenate kinase